MKIRQPIILCGFMSCGKTTVGIRLAEKLGIPFHDTDQMLIRQNQMTIPEMFAKGGEALFRDLEHEIAKQVCTMGPSVISTGGGMLIPERNAAILSRHGVIIYIRRPFERCYASISRQPDRPLFKNHTKEELAETYQKRAEIYQKYAAFTIKNDSTPEDAVRQILSALCADPESAAAQV